MNTARWVGAATTLLFGAALWVGTAGAQVTQAELARSIAHGGSYERFAAAQKVLEMGPRNAGPALRDALVTAFSDEAEAFRAYRRGEAPQPDLDALGTMAMVLGEYGDPRTLRPFTAALGTGPAVARGLAAFGDPAVPYLVEVVRTDEESGVVTDALLALRFIAEEVGRVPLSPSSREDLSAVARERMRPKQSSVGVLALAIDLAVVLGERELVEAVEAMATDPAEVQSRLESWSPRGVEWIVERARDRLRGEPPLPRWELVGQPPGGVTSVGTVAFGVAGVRCTSGQPGCLHTAG